MWIADELPPLVPGRRHALAKMLLYRPLRARWWTPTEGEAPLIVAEDMGKALCVGDSGPQVILA